MNYDIAANLDAARSVLVIGQKATSRTETLEWFFSRTAPAVVSILMAGARHKTSSKCTVYENGRETRSFPLPSYHINAERATSKGALLRYYTTLALAIVKALTGAGARFDLCVGVSTFYTLVGIILKKIGMTKHVIYFSIDYFATPDDEGKIHGLGKIFVDVDRYCCRNADVVWNLSPNINTQRKKLFPDFDEAKSIVVPLTYNATILRSRPMEDVEKCTIGFIGTLEKLQGLQLVIESLPRLVPQFPDIKVKIFGTGPFEKELKEKVRTLNLDGYFTFYGFVQSDEELYSSFSLCTVGVAPFVPVKENNALHTDPGKPKLYAALGVPVIITKEIPSAKEISDSGAGIAISYDPAEFVSAVARIFSDRAGLLQYKRNALEYARRYTTENVYPEALNKSMEMISQKK